MATLGRGPLLAGLLWLTACSPPLDWFLTKDQQGRLWHERGEPARAARAFQDPLWKGIAYYAAEDFASASAALVSVASARGRFQYGNALARQERLPDAIVAYEQALDLQPDFPEAVFNRDWVQALIELDRKEYEDSGGTDGKLEADKIVFDEEGSKGKGEMTSQEARVQGLGEEELRELWMRRVQTTPADFIRLKFAFQNAAETQDETQR